MAVGSGLPVNRAAQVERIDDPARRELEVRADQVRDDDGVDLLGSERLNQHANRIGDANGIGELHFATVGESAGDEVLGDVTRHVRRRAIDLGRIFAAERAPAVTSHAAVAVNDDLAASESGVAHGTADDESSGGIDVVLAVFIEQVRRNHCLNHVLQNAGAKLVVADGLGVLRGDHHGVHAKNFAVGVVFHRDLGFAVGAKEGKCSVLAHQREPLRQLVRERDGCRHQLFVLVHRVPEHHSLVAGAPGIDAHGDVAGLLVDAGDHSAGVGVEAVEGVVVSDGGDGAANHGLKIDVGLGGDFSRDDDEAGSGQGLAGHPAAGVVREASIEDGIRDLVGDLIGMSFGDRFRGEQITVIGWQVVCLLKCARHGYWIKAWYFMPVNARETLGVLWKGSDRDGAVRRY